MSCESAFKWRADWTSTSRRRRRGWLNKCSAEPVSSNQRSCKKSQHCPQLRFISQLNLIKMVYWSLMSATCIQNQNNELVKILNIFWCAICRKFVIVCNTKQTKYSTMVYFRGTMERLGEGENDTESKKLFPSISHYIPWARWALRFWSVFFMYVKAHKNQDMHV